MAGTAAVITVTFIHPIDVVKVSRTNGGKVYHLSLRSPPRFVVVPFCAYIRVSPL